MGRPRFPGKLDRLIERATKNNRLDEFATAMKVTRHAVYCWNKGCRPELAHQVKINALCRKHGMRPIYRFARDLRSAMRPATMTKRVRRKAPESGPSLPTDRGEA